jgi:hypothetical protein
MKVQINQYSQVKWIVFQGAISKYITIPIINLRVYPLESFRARAVVRGWVSAEVAPYIFQPHLCQVIAQTEYTVVSIEYVIMNIIGGEEILLLEIPPSGSKARSIYSIYSAYAYALTL